MAKKPPEWKRYIERFRSIVPHYTIENYPRLEDDIGPGPSDVFDEPGESNWPPLTTEFVGEKNRMK